MPAAALPANETARLAALHSYDVLDTACEASFDEVVQLAARLTRRPIALVSLVDAHRQVFKAKHGLNLHEAPRDGSICAHTILQPTAPMVVVDAWQDPRFADSPLLRQEPQIRSYVGMPLVDAQGFALGALCVIDREPRDATPDDLAILRGLARSVSTSLELRRAMQRLRQQTVTDGLTGLANRCGLMATLDAALARQRPFAALFIDLDGFKQINDRQGHAAGDTVLRTVAEALQGSVRPEDRVARPGGDEFCVVLDNAEAAQLVAARLRATLARRLRQRGFAVTASIGAMTFATMPASAEAALAAADALMYSAKAAGKDRVQHAEYHGPIQAPATGWPPVRPPSGMARRSAGLRQALK